MLTRKQLLIANKVINERFDIRTLFVQMYHMTFAVQRILRELKLPDEPLSISFKHSTFYGNKQK